MIVGQDTAFTFAKLAYASMAIQLGARFIATNQDATDMVGAGADAHILEKLIVRGADKV